MTVLDRLEVLPTQSNPLVATEGEPDNAKFDMYRHPHQLVEREPFHQDFDIYIIGFLLAVEEDRGYLQNV